jgi:acyl-homoserine lactone acylase PvdQ
VNAFVAKGPLPLEFGLLRYRPEPWSPVDTLSIVKGMAYQLCYSWRSILAQWHCAHILADRPQLARELLRVADLKSADHALRRPAAAPKR